MTAQYPRVESDPAAAALRGQANGYASLNASTKVVEGRPDQAILARELADLARTRGWLPTGAITETFPRYLCMNPLTIVSGRLQLGGGIVLSGGRAVTSISVFAHSPGVTSPTNQWFCLADKSGNVLAKTADDTTTAWSAGSVKTLTITGGPYTPANAIEVYVGVCVVAATPPGLSRPGSASGAQIGGGGYGDNGPSGLTTPGSLASSIGPFTFGQNAFYAYIS